MTQTTETIEKSKPRGFPGKGLLLPNELRDKIVPIAEHYGYESISLTARNCIRVGLAIFNSNPDRFLMLLQDNNVNYPLLNKQI
jgi:hypothetical protein